MTRTIFVLALSLLALPAAAQEAGQAGLAVGAPGSIGIIWHVSDAIAIRPDFTFTHIDSESGYGGVTNTETTGWATGFGVGAIFYMGEIHDNVRTYVTPRFNYARTNSTRTDHPTPIPNVITSDATLETHQNNYTYSGSFGVQFTPTRRFSVYGEAGFTYSSSHVKSSSASYVMSIGARSTNSAWGSRAGVGIVLYFN